MAAQSLAGVAECLQDIATELEDPTWPLWLVDGRLPLMEWAVTERRYPLFAMLAAVAFRAQWANSSELTRQIVDHTFMDAAGTMSTHMELEAEAFPATGYFVDAIASYLWRSPQASWETQVQALSRSGRFGSRARSLIRNAERDAFGEWERQELSNP